MTKPMTPAQLKARNAQDETINNMGLNITGTIECPYHSHYAVFFDNSAKNIQAPFGVIVFRGKQQNPLEFNTYASEEMVRLCSISAVERWIKEEVEMQERKNAPMTVKVGDILYASWGFEQTNINFFKVVALKGKKSFIVREVCQERKDHEQGMCGNTYPVADEFKGGTSEVTVRYNPVREGCVSISMPDGFGDVNKLYTLGYDVNEHGIRTYKGKEYSSYA